jgi:hypothetical protein
MQGKVYEGERYPSGDTEVTVNGQPLRHVDYHSQDLDWGYNGSGPAEVALSILADYFGEDQVTGDTLRAAGLATPAPKCWHYHQDFKRDLISGLPSQGKWRINSDTISRWLTTEPPMP